MWNLFVSIINDFIVLIENIVPVYRSILTSVMTIEVDHTPLDEELVN